MRTPLRIAVAQPLSRSGDVAGNADRHADLVRRAQARVVVFPELSLTGYGPDAPVLDPETDGRLASLVAACADSGALAVAGAPVAGPDGRIHIAMLAVDGAGARVAYRKMFLGGAEPQRYSPGDAPAVLSVDGWRLGLAICKDTGVPRHAAETAALGIDGYVAGVLESAADAHVTDERAARVVAEHRVWVAVASFAGGTGGGFTEAAGRSGVWSRTGTPLARAGTAVGEVVTATLTDHPPGHSR
ncbi:carbon-nitrogen hydrolase family protein [Micromonospora sp. PLK6-60]|uniref:carbon-nitrogen hydrolase family protein n=1 Tax=Micromonospora sp. PLK6-60 TaxID=2873383 RepID=UPI001CA67A79|nr:carbon-nitrogen hydrolase family protein [Micromonospora sp. PLK6-60]MBY8874610.1 carbon-nitrogen hydrolase family protein [Micromonospora sp. PLK6-60]